MALVTPPTRLELVILRCRSIDNSRTLYQLKYDCSLSEIIYNGMNLFQGTQKRDKMKKTHLVVLVVAGVILLTSLALVLTSSGSLTSGTVFGDKQCMGPKAALKFINEQGCERIFEDPRCEEKGLVEIRCPPK